MIRFGTGLVTVCAWPARVSVKTARPAAADVKDLLKFTFIIFWVLVIGCLKGE